jgi:hypothetical protein
MEYSRIQCGGTVTADGGRQKADGRRRGSPVRVAAGDLPLAFNTRLADP